MSTRSASHFVGEALPLENRTSPITHSALLEQELSPFLTMHSAPPPD
ncbi:MAG: hypothetical protein NT070_01190 [Cyanobacteria bacterium]|nr:hypothetical protein [Cyanobacteriota bacterium]